VIRMSKFLLAPPIAFLMFLLLSLGLSKVTGLFAAKGKFSVGKTKAYACGEEVIDQKILPDYSMFFPFAFFFTIMHVVTLIVATDPSGISPISVLYLLVAVTAIFILFRR